jgi:spermidine synthase
LVSLRPTAEGNTVVLAFLGPVLQVAWPVLMQRAQQLEKKTGLPATGWVKWLKKQRPGAFFMV